MPAIPRAMNSSATSIMTTSSPATAETWTMPAPIWPAPATSSLLTLTLVLLVVTAREPVRWPRATMSRRVARANATAGRRDGVHVATAAARVRRRSRRTTAGATGPALSCYHATWLRRPRSSAARCCATRSRPCSSATVAASRSSSSTARCTTTRTGCAPRCRSASTARRATATSTSRAPAAATAPSACEGGDHRLVLPAADDCISLLLGSRARYLEEHGAQPGTYYYTRGWVDFIDDPYKEYLRDRPQVRRGEGGNTWRGSSWSTTRVWPSSRRRASRASTTSRSTWRP